MKKISGDKHIQNIAFSSQLVPLIFNKKTLDHLHEFLI
jgi:hypothetical protein